MAAQPWDLPSAIAASDRSTVAARPERAHTILLGGIGGDSHSVGLTILRHALHSHGFRVRYIGIQNSLEDFFQLGSLCNVAMISSMDGHSRYYLRDFPELLPKYQGHRPLWYLGGNLHASDATAFEQQFLEMGFNRVFTRFTDIETVIDFLRRDLDAVEPMPDVSALLEGSVAGASGSISAASDDVVAESHLDRSRRVVLQTWKTGVQAALLDENAEFLGRQPSFPKTQALVHRGAFPILVQPRSGVPTVDEQIRLFRAFRDLHVRVLSYQVDSLTRNNDYAGAEEAIRESARTGVATINGFPVVNQGVASLRRVISETALPLQTRHSTRDPRLLAEISYAGGVTAFEGGAICYNIPYYKNYPLDESIATWQYVDRLTGLYYERYGIPLDREFFGTLTATLIPPSLAIAVNLLESLLAVRQGVKCVSLGYAEQGHRIQDIAAIRTLARMGREVIHNLGYKDVQVNTVFHQYMAAFPDRSDRASEIIYNSAVTAGLSRPTRVMVKTPVEAYRIPDMVDNLEGIALVQRGIAAAAEEWVDEEKVNDECEIIRREAQAIFDSVIHAGGGSIAAGIVRAFDRGYIDIPFSPSDYNAGRVMTARDVDGAVRYLAVGNLQFDRELREFHRDKMSERRRAENLGNEALDYVLVERDVMRVARGQFQRWPLGG